MTETVVFAIMFSILAIAKFGYLDKIFHRIHKELIELRNNQAEDKVKIDLFWSVIQSRVASLVKAPTHERLDELVGRFEEHIATLPELSELEKLLTLRSEEDGLRPIQGNAVALTLLFVADRISIKHEENKTGKSSRTLVRPYDHRSESQKRSDQILNEEEQVAAGERYPHSHPVAELAKILEEIDKKGE